MNYSAKVINPVLPYYRDRADPNTYEQKSPTSLGAHKQKFAQKPGSHDYMLMGNFNPGYRSTDSPLAVPYLDHLGKIF